MADTFLSNPALPIIRPDWQGNALQNGRFLNQFRQGNQSMLLALKWKLTTNPQKDEKKNDKWLPEVLDPRAFLNSQQDGLVWLGHATFFIRLGGVTFLTDPLFFGVSMLKRKVPFPVQPSELPPLDYVLLSHGHFDHCDKDSLKTLRKTHSFTVLTSLKMKHLIQSWLPGIDVQEAGWYQQYQLRENQPKVYYLPAFHWHKRGLTDNNQILWGSFMLQTPEHTLYFGADSGYDQHFKEIQKLFPQIDTCLLGVGAYNPAFIMQPSHTNPAEAVQAFKDLQGGTLVPMHYGTFDLSDEPMGEPVRWLRKMEAEGEIPGKLQVLAIGQALPLK
ncbi:MBL fold metallo-hydrolase [Rufibacter sediminis]|uniref:MBL fold metallo-hydrolase n=1 Tax=Rufibacter sediminis TaxID=2762756 RepID=A0ABR6VLN3_9BACT|nr:MBL fold metallo-hydrolase [Rufibacter sediminis]MBC3538091.1 MBL fold metallo-hydrolase [Rufibacter sediminis]